MSMNYAPWYHILNEYNLTPYIKFDRAIRLGSNRPKTVGPRGGFQELIDIGV